MKPPSRHGAYENPYTAVVFVDAAPYLITERRRDGCVARKMDAAEAEIVRRAFDDVHADFGARMSRRQR